jgi:formylmethanofuran dehydrogenase subunit E
MDSEDFKKCAAFHGHVCPGLSIGFRAAKAGMQWLKENRSEDEEIVAIVETNACPVDAVQVLTGCTFGKGNLIYKDHGKMAFTLLSRRTGNGVRVALRTDALDINEAHMALLGKMAEGRANPEEKARFQSLHLQRSHEVLEKPETALFTITPTQMTLPPKAKIESSEPCEKCGEPTMRNKLEMVDGIKMCGGCLEGRR